MNLNPISPKVIVGLVVGLIFTSIASNVTALDPHVFDFLGPWGLFVFGVLLTLVKALAEYFKTDPLRVVPNTPEPAPSETPASSPGSPAIVTGPGSVAQSDAVTPTPATPAPPSA
ncbi:hypothetical protein AB6813_04885 [bacterium RCC_150]